jgi:hypothetical protein
MPFGTGEAIFVDPTEAVESSRRRLLRRRPHSQWQ